MYGPNYDENFYREEIERLQLFLTQPITEADRASYTFQLEVAKSHLADLLKESE